MYRGDRSRKLSLVNHGYRLPSALDNRPLTDGEFWDRVKQTIFVSATPSKRELLLSDGSATEMQIRPTYVLDPIIHVRPPQGQLDDLLNEVKARALVDERTLAMVLTKNDAEDLASYLEENEVKTTFIHSGLGTQERSAALKSLQTGEIDCLVGVNLLREGLDLPQCSLVAVFNADADGMFRSQTSLLQIIGRAARNTNGAAIFYANRVTENMRKTIEETAKRRAKQIAYVEANPSVQMVTSIGSSIQSPFDLLRDKIDVELEVSDHIVSNHTIPSARLSRPLISDVPTVSAARRGDTSEFETDHIPSFPGVYYWKDSDNNILYIGKAKNLRSRIMSYLSAGSSRSHRITTMIEKARVLEFEITPSERDALVLESKLIKHHQPPYNVLLKDDNHYPYICARVGDKLPSFTVAAFKDETNIARRHYRYFGPYTSYKEINNVLQSVEETYDLRSQSFLARHGGGSLDDYQKLFDQALQDVFVDGKDNVLRQRRSEYEEAGLLFESSFNECRDVVVAVPVQEMDRSALVHVVQLRKGIVARRFSYTCELPAGFASEEDYGDVLQNVLEKMHYRAGQESPEGLSFFPDEVLLSHPVTDARSLQSAVDSSRKDVEPARKRRAVIKTAALKGERKVADERAIDFAMKNAAQAAYEHVHKKESAEDAILDEATAELASMLALTNLPKMIECYDISHTQGDFPVASRVVFVDGKPAPHLYRTFNIKSVEGVDDYASIQEALQRRFRRFWLGTTDDKQNDDKSWEMPDLIVIDGGPGQLTSAIKGMAQANVLPGNTTHVQQFSTSSPPYATVPVVALAKEQELLYVPGVKDCIDAPNDSPAMLLLRSLRDESHRFALKAHRRRRSVTKAYR